MTDRHLAVSDWHTFGSVWWSHINSGRWSV